MKVELRDEDSKNTQNINETIYILGKITRDTHKLVETFFKVQTHISPPLYIYIHIIRNALPFNFTYQRLNKTLQHLHQCLSYTCSTCSLAICGGCRSRTTTATRVRIPTVKTRLTYF